MAVCRVLPNAWTPAADGFAIERRHEFDDFNVAFAVMTRVAVTSEQHNYHPQWISNHDHVSMRWTTDDVDGLSARDIELAKMCDGFAGQKALR